MPCLKANFEADWIVHLREHMVKIQGWPADEIGALDDRDVPNFYFEACRRRVVPARRKIEIADDFICPRDHGEGWALLQDKVRRGDDINPYLSKRHASLIFSDGLLAEWGVHHFHLGIAPDPDDPDYMGRTGPLLYALVASDAFYAINIYDHQRFEDNSIIERIHQNWPELISRYRVKGVSGGDWSSDKRRTLRRKNANVLTTVADGTVYMPISGGVMGSGTNVDAVRLADYWGDRLKGLQSGFGARIDEILPALQKNGYAGESEIDARLEFSKDGVQVFFPKYLVVAKLSIVEGEC